MVPNRRHRLCVALLFLDGALEVTPDKLRILNPEGELNPQVTANPTRQDPRTSMCGPHSKRCDSTVGSERRYAERGMQARVSFKVQASLIQRHGSQVEGGDGHNSDTQQHPHESWRCHSSRPARSQVRGARSVAETSRKVVCDQTRVLARVTFRKHASASAKKSRALGHHKTGAVRYYSQMKVKRGGDTQTFKPGSVVVVQEKVSFGGNAGRGKKTNMYNLNARIICACEGTQRRADWWW